MFDRREAPRVLGHARRSRVCPGLAVVSLLALSACGTTHRFVDEPKLSIADPAKNPRDAAAELFHQTTAYTVTLCEADQASRECKKEQQGIGASGVGGLFLPLSLRVTALIVSDETESPDGWLIDTSVRSKVDAIAPLCRSIRGKILVRDNDTISVELPDFFCNWMAVGNVVVNADLSIDSIDVKTKTFTGFYKITFHGTGNASGSGYYRAAVISKG
jgi:hypothetical protein